MDGGDGGGGGVWRSWNTCTMGVMLLIFTCQLLRWLLTRIRIRIFSFLQWFPILPSDITPTSPDSSSPLPQPSPCSRISTIISDSDLKHLLEDLKEEKLPENGQWEGVIDRRSTTFSYSAKSYKPKDEPTKYISVTIFENCSPELLRDFYMDNHYRKLWDKTVIEHEQLQLDESTGTEIGRLVKKFPFLTLREYVLAWRVWKDSRGAFYCLSKGCEHPFAPKQKKYVRATFFRSGWRIKKVAGRNACEIRMVHQEDAGLNEELAKLAFAKGIWSYICKMNNALCKYSPPPTSVSVAAIQKFPLGLDPLEDITDSAYPGTSMTNSVSHQVSSDGSTRKVPKRPSKKLIKNGLILLGGAICLSRGRSSLGAKVAMAYILTKLTKHGTLSRQNREA